MLDFFENTVFAFAGIVIILLAAGICIAGTPSSIHLAELPTPVTVTDPKSRPEFEEIIFPGEQTPITGDRKSIRNIYRKGKGNILIPETGLDKNGRKRYLGPFRYGNSSPEKTYTLLDKRYREKYSNLQDAYQLALMGESVFAKDANGLDIIEITYITPGSVLDQLGLEKGDKVYSIVRYPVSSEKEALDLFYTLKDRDVFCVELVRNGRPMIMNFKFE